MTKRNNRFVTAAQRQQSVRSAGRSPALAHQMQKEANLPKPGRAGSQNTVTLAPSVATSLTLLPTSSTIDDDQTQTYTVQILDQYNAPMAESGVTVNFTAQTVTGSFNPVSPVTDGSGQATTIFTPSAAGTGTITATIPSPDLGSKVSSLTINATVYVQQFFDWDVNSGIWSLTGAGIMQSPDTNLSCSIWFKGLNVANKGGQEMRWWALGNSAAAGDSTLALYKQTDERIRFRCEGNTLWASTIERAVVVDVLDDALHHLVMSFGQNGEFKIFIDGVKNFTGGPAWLPSVAATDRVIIGQSHQQTLPPSGANPPEGQIADMGLWYKELTDQECLDMYNGGVPPNPGAGGVNLGGEQAAIFFGGSMTEANWLAGAHQGSLDPMVWNPWV